VPARAGDAGVGANGRRRVTTSIPWTERLSLPAVLVVALLVVALGVLLGVAGGCSHPTRAQQRAESEAGWRRLRAGVRYQLASQQYAGGLTAESIDTVEEAIALDPAAVDYYILLARACQEHGQLSRALQAIERASQVDPTSAEVAYTFGTIEERCRRTDRALTHFERAAELDPHQADFLIARAECLVALDRAEEAYELVSARIHDFDRDGALETLLARIALLLGRDEEAATSFRIALDVVGSNDSLSEQYGLVLNRLGRHAEAIAVLQPLIESQGESAGGAVARALATSYLHARQPHKAEAVIETQLANDSADAQAWLLLAKIAIHAGDLSAARRCADRVGELAPDHPQTHLIQGYVSARENRLTEARRAYERALEFDPADVLVHCLLGDVFHRLQERDRARSHYSRALQIDADCRWARRALSELDAQDLLDGDGEEQLSRLDSSAQ